MTAGDGDVKSPLQKKEAGGADRSPLQREGNAKGKDSPYARSSGSGRGGEVIGWRCKKQLAGAKQFAVGRDGEAQL